MRLCCGPRFNNPIAVIDSWYTRTLSFMYIQVRSMAARHTDAHTLACEAHTALVTRCVWDCRAMR